MQEPHDHRVAEVDKKFELSVEIMFDVNPPSETFNYRWEPPKGKMIDKNFKNSNTNTLIINKFEYRYEGEYTCVVSTAQEPMVSVSAKVTVDFPSRK